MKTRSGRILQTTTPAIKTRKSKAPAKKVKTQKIHFSKVASSVAKQSKQSYKKAMKNPVTKFLYHRQNIPINKNKITHVKLPIQNSNWNDIFPNKGFLKPPPIPFLKKTASSNTSNSSKSKSEDSLSGW